MLYSDGVVSKKVENAYHLSLFDVNELKYNVLTSDKHPLACHFRSLLVTSGLQVEVGGLTALSGRVNDLNWPS